MDKREARLHELGAAIARERELKGLTQEQLSHMIGNSNHSYLSRIESGQKAPSLKTLFNVADALGVRVYYFFMRI